jgi:hypothetical protein
VFCFFLWYTHCPACFNTVPKPHILGFGLYWVVMLSHAVMRVVQVFPSFVMLSLACVFVRGGLPSIEMWFDPGEDRWCGLSKVGMVETVGFHQVMWRVMLESAKDRVLEVDTIGQHVPPCVRYGMACWLMRKALVSLSYRSARLVCLYLRDCKVQEVSEGILSYPTGGNHSNYERGLRVYCDTQQGETCGKARHTIWS